MQLVIFPRKTDPLRALTSSENDFASLSESAPPAPKSACNKTAGHRIPWATLDQSIPSSHLPAIV